MAREDEYCLEGRRYALYAEIVGPTDIGRHRPRKRCGGRPRRAHCFPRCVAVPPSPWWTLVVDAFARANERGAAKNRDRLAWSRIEPQNFGAGTARFCRTRPKTVSQLHFSHGRMSPVSSVRGLQVECVREHSGGA